MRYIYNSYRQIYPNWATIYECYFKSWHHKIACEIALKTKKRLEVLVKIDCPFLIQPFSKEDA